MAKQWRSSGGRFDAAMRGGRAVATTTTGTLTMAAVATVIPLAETIAAATRVGAMVVATTGTDPSRATAAAMTVVATAAVGFGPPRGRYEDRGGSRSGFDDRRGDSLPWGGSGERQVCQRVLALAKGWGWRRPVDPQKCVDNFVCRGQAFGGKR